MSVNKVNPSTGELELIAGGTLYADAPIGTIQAYGGASSAIPQGWLYCNGAAVSRTIYAELFAVIGTSFGTGDGSTTFNIPDLRGEFLRGAGNNSHSNQGNGGTVGQHQDATYVFGSYYDANEKQISLYNDNNGVGFGNYDKRIATNTRGLLFDVTEVQGGENTDKGTVRPTNTSVNYIIKAKQVALPADFLSNITEIYDQLAKLGRTYTTRKSEISFNALEEKDIAITFTNIPKGKYTACVAYGNNDGTGGSLYDYTYGGRIYQFGWSRTNFYPLPTVFTQNVDGTFTFTMHMRQTENNPVTNVYVDAHLIQVGLVL